nr:winged helix-turn-helix transcriptional regulator [Phascolarctobacterium succinatutens]
MFRDAFIVIRIEQLRAMEESGLVHRQVYAEVPPKVEYSLTELGLSLKPILDCMWVLSIVLRKFLQTS